MIHVALLARGANRRQFAERAQASLEEGQRDRQAFFHQMREEAKQRV